MSGEVSEEEDIDSRYVLRADLAAAQHYQRGSSKNQRWPQIWGVEQLEEESDIQESQSGNDDDASRSRKNQA